jgi:hypothetical protein
MSGLLNAVARLTAHRDRALQNPAKLDAATIGLIAALVNIYRNQVALFDYGETDTLTGLLNHKTYDAAFHDAAQPSAAEQQSSPAAPRPAFNRAG